jgi:hypothetical protein
LHTHTHTHTHTATKKGIGGLGGEEVRVCATAKHVTDLVTLLPATDTALTATGAITTITIIPSVTSSTANMFTARLLQLLLSLLLLLLLLLIIIILILILLLESQLSGKNQGNYKLETLMIMRDSNLIHASRQVGLGLRVSCVYVRGFLFTESNGMTRYGQVLLPNTAVLKWPQKQPWIKGRYYTFSCTANSTSPISAFFRSA